MKSLNWIYKEFFIYIIPISIIFFGMRALFSVRMAYSDFYPFSVSWLDTVHRFTFLWSENFVGSFDPKGISYILRSISEFIAFNNPIFAQGLYTFILFMIAYMGMKFFLSTFKVHKYISIFIPIFYIYNPITISEYANGITGILIIYAMIPWLFYIVDVLISRYSVPHAVAFSIIIAFMIFNLQTGFWILLVSGIYFIFKLYKQEDRQNLSKLIVYMTIHFFIGVLLNPSFFFVFFSVSEHFGNFNYLPDFLHNYKRISFLNLFQMIGNNGSPQVNLGYFNNGYLMSLSMIPFLIILYALTIFRYVKMKMSERNTFFFIVCMIISMLFILVLIKLGYLNEAIENKNLLLISVRNPQKILYIFSFAFISLLAISLNIIHLYFSRKEKKKTYTLILLFAICSLFVQNNHFFSGDFGLHATRKSGYYIDEHSEEISNQLKKLDGNVLILPFDYSMQLKYSWDTNVVLTRMGAKKSGDDYSGDLLETIYSGICNQDESIVKHLKDLGVDFILLDKKPSTYKKHKEEKLCEVTGLYGTPYIWGDHNLFNEIFKFYTLKYRSSDFVVYATNTAISPNKDYIDTVSTLNMFDNIDLRAAHFFNYSIFGHDTAYGIADNSENIPSIRTSVVLGNISLGDINKNIVSKNSFVKTEKNSLYVNIGNTVLKIHNNFFIKEYITNLYANNQHIDVEKSDEVVMELDQNGVAIRNGVLIKSIKDGLQLDNNIATELYSSSGNNIFSITMWDKDVVDCNNYDDNPMIDMQKVDRGDGFALQLESTRHTACVSKKSDAVQADAEYLVEFDYNAVQAKQAGFYIGFSGSVESERKSYGEKLAVPKHLQGQWQHYAKIVRMPKGAKSASFYLYAYESDGVENNIVQYDNVSMRKVKLVHTIEPSTESEFVQVPLPEPIDGKYSFEYRDPTHDFTNQIPNASFNDGLWASKVGDCHNYDDNPILEMQKVAGRDGAALSLGATRHTACTSQAGIAVHGGAEYLFEFDYQSDNAKSAGYYISFNDSEHTVVSEKPAVEGQEWQTFTKRITVPSDATSMSLHAYSYPKGGKENIITKYDNFKLIELPNIANRYYLVSEPSVEIAKPKGVGFELINPTKKLVHITGASKPFYLTMSESYHDKWQLQLNNSKVQGFFKSWVPFAKPDAVGNDKHFKYMTFLNGWYVDPTELCASVQSDALDTLGTQDGCTLNPDGSYDIEMVIEFTPQRYFYLGLLISGTTFIALISYLGYDWYRRKRYVKKFKKTKRG